MSEAVAVSKETASRVLRSICRYALSLSLCLSLTLSLSPAHPALPPAIAVYKAAANLSLSHPALPPELGVEKRPSFYFEPL